MLASVYDLLIYMIGREGREGGSAHLYRLQHLDDAGMAQRTKLADGVPRKREARLVGVDIEGEYTARGAIFL